VEDLASQQCQGKADLLSADAISHYIKHIDTDWQLGDDKARIKRVFKFKNYYETMAFVNVVAMIAHQQDHHPDMSVSYNICTVQYSTHSVGGLSQYDFICAAKIDTTLPI
jgi:4a-hydroxytetrahydrobiopterin dehydratase